MSTENQHIMYSIAMDEVYFDDLSEMSFEFTGAGLEIGDTVEAFRHIMKSIRISDYHHCDPLLEEIEDDFSGSEWFKISIVEKAMETVIAHRPKFSREIKGVVTAIDEGLKIEWEEGEK